MSNSNYKILIVEDEDSILRMYEVKFSLEGFEVLMARDGQDALNVLQKESPDVILADLIMPNIDGFEFIEKIQDKKIPIIILTNLDQDWSEERGKNLGVVDYFIKSQVTPEAIVVKVKQILEK